jgi:hypothetical protein
MLSTCKLEIKFNINTKMFAKMTASWLPQIVFLDLEVWVWNPVMFWKLWWKKCLGKAIETLASRLLFLKCHHLLLIP